MKTVTRQHSAVRRILAIKLGHLGDVLLMTPALELLHRLYPEAEISVMVRRGTEAMLQDNPLIKRVIVGAGIGRKRPVAQRVSQERGLVRQVRRERFDLVVDFSGSDRGAICAFLSGAPERVGYASEGKGFWGRDFLFTHVCHRSWKTTHTVLKDAQLVCDYATAMGRTGFEDAAAVTGELVLAVAPEDSRWARGQWQTFARDGALRVLVHPTSRWLFKCWNDEKVAAVIDQLAAEFGASVLLTSGPGEKEIAKGKAILSLCKSKTAARLGDLSLGQLAALIREADLFVGVDSAPMHMAAAVGRPVVAVFGPSLNKLWAPWGVEHRVVRRHCPCIQMNKIVCDKRRVVNCMDAVPASEVVQAARELLVVRLLQQKPQRGEHGEHQREPGE
jgi:heptosyltransferase-3